MDSTPTAHWPDPAALHLKQPAPNSTWTAPKQHPNSTLAGSCRLAPQTAGTEQYLDSTQAAPKQHPNSTLAGSCTTNRPRTAHGQHPNSTLAGYCSLAHPKQHPNSTLAGSCGPARQTASTEQHLDSTRNSTQTAPWPDPQSLSQDRQQLQPVSTNHDYVQTD